MALDLDGLLDVDDLPDDIRPLAVNEADVTSFGTGADHLVGKTLEEVEKFYIQRALEITEGRREEAAKMLNIGERTLYRKINEYGLRN